MNKLRYSDEKYLCDYDLDTDLFELFDLKVEDLIPLRSVYILITDKGKKILKKIENTEDMKFITSALDYIKDGYSDILTFVKAGDGNYYVRWKDGIYCVMELIEGRECCCSNPLDVVIASKALAQYHKSSLGILKYLEGSNLEILKSNLGKFPNKFNEAKENLLDIKQRVGKYGYKNTFDKLLLESIDEQIENINESIKRIEKSNYENLCRDESKTVLCHNDLAHHNIILSEDRAYFIDFEYSLVDIRVHDICNFLMKSIKNYGYDFDKSIEIINAYDSVWKIEKDELEVLYAIMIFPNDYYNLVYNYYNKKKNWSYESFLSKFQNKLADEPDRKDFLKIYEEKKITK
ncbi:CotS family spore coat protein [Clostridium intestinale]|uniref:Spore coat protein, CotS family n=1 Tax=Clostridium intestinale DSM 6191 TaxID=1121320 RepID=A0A1M6DCW4_9CLOT|nr:CotS family spore coat protein [Clostridium intestinale]SHI71010.1 spore coat protein, CotS family [Clostridium intestinale DSM 6191]